MSLRVYNTMSKRKEEFVPREEGKVSMYVCGVTPYNYPHLGNARPFVVFDVVRRYFEYLGYETKHVQNFTDVDDKIIKRGQEEGKTAQEVARTYIDAYYEDMDQLGVRRAHIYPLVTTHIGEIIEMVERLVEQGYAYELEGDVYFSVNSYSDYGKLSGRSLDELKAGARVEVDQRKRNPLDFALWKRAKEGEPAWDSPWGPGRPGWHIECSAMSLKYLGAGFDLHGGGSDLVFPHHENEIAQSEAYTGGQQFVRYWLHNGFITIDQEKMSKSLGNFFTVRDILKQYSPDVVRFFLISTHYRSPLDFSDKRLDEAGRSLERFYNVLDQLGKIPQPASVAVAESPLLLEVEKVEQRFREAMDDDFNTALAIGYLFEFVREVNRVLADYRQGDAKSAETAWALKKAEETLIRLGNVLGIFELRLEGEGDQLAPKLLDFLVELRQEFRKNKDWASADKVRDRLQELGVVLEDGPQGTFWRRK
jgi:cysteinyl-tRNA synthetase